MTRAKEEKMISVHVDTLKKAALYAVLVFVSWNWAAAEKEVRNLTQVGTSIGEGWSQCMVVLKPKVDGLEALAGEILGFAQTGEAPEGIDDRQAGTE